MPPFAIVDSHVHFWDHARVPVSWTRSEPVMARDYGPEDYDADAVDVAVEAIVFVETNVDPGGHIPELDMVARLAAEEPRIKAIVAHAPLHRDADVSDDLATFAAHPLVRGVRTLLQDKDAAALVASSHFRAHVAALASYDLHFEICIYHPQLPAAIELVQACPGVRFVLDHIAKPGIKGRLTDPWHEELRQIAGFANVDCKISGVATEADHTAWLPEDLHEYVDWALDVFGPSRVLFGSDWPVMRSAIGFRQWVDLVDRAVAHWCEDDRRALFRDNAVRVYRLDLTPAGRES